MPGCDSKKRGLAKKLYLDSGGTIKLRVIAEQVDAKQETVRGWKARDKWDDSLPKEELGKKKPRGLHKGDCIGNANAAGNHTHPKSTEKYVGNQNAYTTGLYAKLKYADLSDEEKELVGIVCEDNDPIQMQRRLIAELTVRESRMYHQIAKIKADDQGLVVDSTIQELRVKNGDTKGTPHRMTAMKKTAVDKILDIEAALSIVQQRKQTAISSLHTMLRNTESMKMERERLEIEQAKLELQRRRQAMLEPDNKNDEERLARMKSQMQSIADMINADPPPPRDLPD